MAKRVSEAEWRGDLKDGAGTLKLGSGAFEGKYSFRSRFEDGPGTNPEELIAAAHAACFSMALSVALSQMGHVPTRIHTTATVDFGPVPGGFAISRIALDTEAQVPGISAAMFEKAAQAAKVECPVSEGPRSRGSQSGGEASEIEQTRSVPDRSVRAQLAAAARTGNRSVQSLHAQRGQAMQSTLVERPQQRQPTCRDHLQMIRPQPSLAGAGEALEFGRLRVLLRRRQSLAGGMPTELGAWNIASTGRCDTVYGIYDRIREARPLGLDPRLRI